MNQRNNWMPQMSMPPLGFGVVMPQPGRIGTVQPAYGITPQTVPQIQPIAGNGPDNGTHWQYQQFNIGQQGTASVYPQHYASNQQQLHSSQQNVAQEHKLLYEKMMKQKQFNDQKQRLKEFSSRTKKVSVTADAMIQNIFDKQEQQSSKCKNAKDCPATSHSTLEYESRISGSNYYPTPVTHSTHKPDQDTSFSNIVQPQPSYNSNYLVDGKPNSQNYISQNFSTLGPNTIPPSNDSVGPSSLTSVNPSHMVEQNSKISLFQNSISSSMSLNSSSIQATDNVKMNSNSVPHQAVAPSSQGTKSLPALNLPHWLTDASKLPELYNKAAGLVQSDNEWVDTSRAYMLLMQTNVPPHFLGVLWEMVNRSQPGRLRVQEFHALLALVACVQNGKTFINAEVLASLEEPVYPLINHPVLLPLTQEKLKAQISPSVDSKEQDHAPSFENPPQINAVSSMQCSLQSETAAEGDDFDDFVSASISPVANANPTSNSNVMFPRPPPPPPSSVGKITPLPGPNSNSHHQRTSSVDANRSNPVKNLPTLGNSPVNHPKSRGDAMEDEDDFDEFQSAPSLTIPTCKVDPATSVKPDAPNKTNDKYAVFRDLLEDESESNPVSNHLNNGSTTDEPPLRSDIPHNVFESKHVDTKATSNEWDNTDGFGDFVATQPCRQSFTEVSSESSTYLTANVSADTSNDDDDFGDFVGSVEPSTLAAPALAVQELKSETQSVASLELPGLEFTVNLAEPGDYPSNPSSRMDPLAVQPNFSAKHSDWLASEKDLDREFEELRLADSEKGKTLPLNESILSNEVPVVSPMVLLSDKYSVIRECDSENGVADSPLVELWGKCLEGCKKLLEEGVAVVTKLLLLEASLMTQVLASPQMKDYLSNLSEVWRVSQRIEVSNSRLESNPTVAELVANTNRLWVTVCQDLGKMDSLKVNESGIPTECQGHTTCGLCLVAGEDVSLAYGGHSYHPPCANLWINVVDLTLPAIPSDRPAQLSSRPTLL